MASKRYHMRMSPFCRWILRHFPKRCYRRYKWRRMMVKRYGKDWRKTLNPLTVCVNPLDADKKISPIPEVISKDVVCPRCKEIYTRDSNYNKRICKDCISNIFTYLKTEVV